MAKFEKTGLRDLGLVALHVRNNLHCRAGGIQFLMLEYHHGMPKALIDFRRFEDGFPDTSHPIYVALARLAGDLPFFLAFHTLGWGFYLSGVNAAARHSIGGDALKSEAEFVGWLHEEIRGVQPRERMFPRGLGNQKPDCAPTEPAGVPNLLRFNGAMWPGQDLSFRHRDLWGYNCPAVDLDFLLVDHNFGISLALVEYKRARAAVDWSHGNITAQRVFAGNLPFILARYLAPPRDYDWMFRVENPPESGVPNDLRWMREPQWFDHLNSLRGANYRSAQMSASGSA